MRVKIVMGGGYGRLPDGKIGEVRQSNLMGDLIQGALPSAGSQGVLGRKDGTTLAVQIGDSSQLPDGRVSVRIDQVDLPTRSEWRVCLGERRVSTERRSRTNTRAGRTDGSG